MKEKLLPDVLPNHLGRTPRTLVIEPGMLECLSTLCGIAQGVCCFPENVLFCSQWTVSNEGSQGVVLGDLFWKKYKRGWKLTPRPFVSIFLKRLQALGWEIIIWSKTPFYVSWWFLALHPSQPSNPNSGGTSDPRSTHGRRAGARSM